jgi:hypothetical protein
VNTCRFCPIFRFLKRVISHDIFLLAVKQDKRRERRSHAWEIKKRGSQKGVFRGNDEKGGKFCIFRRIFFYQATPAAIVPNRQPESFAFYLKILDYTLRFLFLKLSHIFLIKLYHKYESKGILLYSIDINDLLMAPCMDDVSHSFSVVFSLFLVDEPQTANA